MKIGLTQNSAQKANLQSGSFVGERGQRSFGNILVQQAASEKYSYDASARGRTHSFSEMPIVAPAATKSPQSSKASGRQTVKANGVEAAGPILPETPNAHFAQPDAISLVVDSDVQILTKGKLDVFRQTMPHAISAFPSATLLRQNQVLARFTSAPSVSAPSPSGAFAAARQSPFHIQLSEAAAGLRISIVANSLSDSEQLELEGKASELARRYGLAVSEVRVSKFGRRS